MADPVEPPTRPQDDFVASLERSGHFEAVAAAAEQDALAEVSSPPSTDPAVRWRCHSGHEFTATEQRPDSCPVCGKVLVQRVGGWPRFNIEDVREDTSAEPIDFDAVPSTDPPSDERPQQTRAMRQIAADASQACGGSR